MRIVTLNLFFTVLIIAGCSGSKATDPAIRITEENALEVAAASAISTNWPMFGVFSASSLFAYYDGYANLGAAMEDGINESTGINSVQRMVQTPLLADDVDYRSTRTNTIQCLTGGSVTVVAANRDDQNPLSAIGDTFDVIASNCDDGQDPVKSGTVSMTMKEFVGDIPMPLSSVTFTNNFIEFTMTDSDEISTLNGLVTIVGGTDDGVDFTTAYSGNSFKYSESLFGSGHITNFSIATTDIGIMGESIREFSGVISTDRLGGHVQYTTTSPFRTIGSRSAYSGVLDVIGEQSNLTVTVISENGMESSGISLALDDDGDGNVDQIIPATWELLGAIR